MSNTALYKPLIFVDGEAVLSIKTVKMYFTGSGSQTWQHDTRFSTMNYGNQSRGFPSLSFSLYLSALYEALLLPWQPRPFLVLRGLTMATKALLCSRLKSERGGEGFVTNTLTYSLSSVLIQRTYRHRDKPSHTYVHMWDLQGLIYIKWAE